MKLTNLERAARLGRVLQDWGEFGKALAKKRARDEPCGISLDVGGIEQDCGGEIVQPDYGIITDAETGRLIINAAKRIIEIEIAKLGVKTA